MDRESAKTVTSTADQRAKDDHQNATINRNNSDSQLPENNCDYAPSPTVCEVADNRNGAASASNLFETNAEAEVLENSCQSQLSSESNNLSREDSGSVKDVTMSESLSNLLVYGSSSESDDSEVEESCSSNTVSDSYSEGNRSELGTPQAILPYDKEYRQTGAAKAGLDSDESSSSSASDNERYVVIEKILLRAQVVVFGKLILKWQY